jgi:hypothetical protein
MSDSLGFSEPDVVGDDWSAGNRNSASAPTTSRVTRSESG